MPVLSIRKSVDALNRADAQKAEREALQAAWVHTLEDAAQYAIEWNESSAAQFRAHLRSIAARASQAAGPASLEQVQADFRGELRQYRDEGQQELRRLRNECTIAVESMRCLIENVSSTGSDHERTLRQEFDTLEATARTADLDTIRAAIHHAADAALHSCELIRKEQQLVIAQLQEEIRGLHREADQERRAALSDPTTGLWNRVKLDSRIKDLILLNETFCVFLIGVPELSRIAAQDARIAPALLRALTGRLQTLTSQHAESGMTGRWSEDSFAIVFNLPLAAAPAQADAIQAALSGTYAVQLGGASHPLHLQVRAQALERRKDSPERDLYMELGRAAFDVISPA